MTGASAVNDAAMFTGLVEAAVRTRSYERVGSGARLVLPSPGEGDLALEAEEGAWGGAASSEPWSAGIGDSVAVAGACLTVVTLQERPGGPPDMVFDLSRGTLEKTWFDRVLPSAGPGGHLVNLERALRVGDRLGGHMVSGHVDTLGILADRQDVGDGGAEFTFRVPGGFERYLIDKGSVTIDGISLTVVDPAEHPDGWRFTVAVIPHTLARTHLADLQPGAPVHLEADLVGKWVERLAARG